MNKLFKSGLVGILLLTLIMIFTPLAFLIGRGVFTLKETLFSEEVIFALKLSLKTSILACGICMLLALPVAYTLSRIHFKGKRLISLILYLPMSLPHLISGIALLLLFGNSAVGRFLQQLGIDFVFTVEGIILAQVFINLSFTIKLLKLGIDKSNGRMEFVARTLGCNEFQCFYKVTLPLIKRDILSASIITFLRALGEFGAVMILVGTTRMKTELLPTAIFLNVSTGDLGPATGIATLLIIISLLFMIPFELLERDRKN